MSTVNSKEALLSAAKSLFIEKGYEAVSTREIAELAGVNLGAIQYHYGSKSKLFLETIRDMMNGAHHCEIHKALLGPIKSKEDAAERLGKYIFYFIGHAVYAEGPQPCHMMFRELFSLTAKDQEFFETLTEVVVNEFIRPTHDILLSIVGILGPKKDPEELGYITQSIVAQCAFYTTHKHFSEKLRNISYKDQKTFNAAVRHIVQFSLRAIGCEESLIQMTLKNLDTDRKSDINPKISDYKSGELNVN